MRDRRGVRVGEQAAQQRNSVAQGSACIVGLTVRPQERGELATGMQTSFDRQVEQQSLRLAQGEGEAAFVVKDFWWAEHGQS